MKRICIFILIAVLTICSCSVSVSAEEIYDSLKISEDEIKALSLDEGQLVLAKLYCGSFMKEFGEKASVDILTADNNVQDEVYMIKSGTDIYYYHIYDGKPYGISISKTESWDDFCNYALKTDEVFDSSITVKNVYCFNGEQSCDGVYIYYVTDKGDYVLYKEYLIAEKQYLFPVSDFYDFAEKVHAERLKNAYSDSGAYAYSGGISVETLYDLKPYELNAVKEVENIAATENVEAVENLASVEKTDSQPPQIKKIIFITAISMGFILMCSVAVAVVVSKTKKSKQ